ncbi:MAG TPA: rhodanese-like domain-containing protein [Armatimonadota bacterium]
MGQQDGYGTLTPAEAQAAISDDPDLVVLDVRTPEEYMVHHIPGARLCPLDSLSARASELDPHLRYLVVCEHGVRSEMAARFLAQSGFTSLEHMSGGMAAYPGPTEFGPANY